MSNNSGFSDADFLGQGLTPFLEADSSELNLENADSSYSDALSKDAPELTPLEIESGELEITSELSDSIDQSFRLSFLNDSQSANPDTITGIDLNGYVVYAGGKLTIKGKSDFDGDALLTTDDASIYAGDGFEIKSNSTFPVLRNDLGEPILDEDGKQQLLNNAVVVSDSYSKAEAKANQNSLSGLIPPQTVEAQTLDLPVYADLVATELDRRLPADAEPVIFNAKQNKIKNAKDWNNKFPQGGTVENPTYVRVTRGKLEIPNNVDLSNYAIVVDKGDIKFKGSNNSLDNVMLLAEDGKLEAKNLNANNTALLASDKIEIKSQSQFTGDSLIANGKGKIEFKGTLDTPNETDSLRVISADDLELKSRSEVRGQLLAKDDLTIKGKSVIYGSLGTKGDIQFDDGVEVIAQNPSPPAALNLDVQLANDTGIDDRDLITSDPTIDGTIENIQGDINLQASLSTEANNNSPDISNLLQPDGSFSLDSAALEDINGGALADGEYTLNLLATDGNGDRTQTSNISFTLDTTAAEIELSESLTDSNITTESQLAGTVNESMVTLSYRFNDGDEIAVELNEGSFAQALDLTGLPEGENSLILTAIDKAGNVTEETIIVTFGEENLAPTITVPDAQSINEDSNLVIEGIALEDTDGSVGELEVTLSATNGTVSLSQSDNITFVEGDGTQADTIVFSGTLVDLNNALAGLTYRGNKNFNGSDELTLTVLDTGDLSLNSSQTIPITINPVNDAPVIEAQTLTIAENTLNDGVVGVVATNDIESDTLTYSIIGGSGESAFDINAETGAIFVTDTAQLDFETTPSFDLNVEVADSQGGTSTATVTIEVGDVNEEPVPLILSGTTPLDGATEVGSTFRPQIFFNEPIDTSTLTKENFYASFSGQKLNANIVPSEDGTFAWLFFDKPMPDSSLIEVTVDGSTIKTADGEVLDANNDGTPGGTSTFSFTTVSLEPVVNTTVTGMVVDPGADLEPFTEDDFNPGADGVRGTEDDEYLLPIAGAEVFVLGLEDQKVVTDEQGRFTLDSVPAGNVKVAVEGMTATNAPEGSYFPEMVMDVNVEPGVENLVMGMEHIYLPRLDNEILNTVAADETTKIAASEASAPELNPEQRDSLSLEIQPESLVGENGEKLDSAEVGISTVPPELVRDMLPPGVLQHTFDITIQAPGVTRFSTPAPITFPNVFDAEPGTQLNFLSFNHETGLLEIEGTATVSADGKTVSSDPGTGITQPGWHGVTPPGGCGGPGGSPPPPPPAPEEGEEVIRVNLEPNLIRFDTEQSNFPTKVWNPPAANNDLPPPPPSPGCNIPNHPELTGEEPFINVTIEIDGPLEEFMSSVEGGLDLVSQRFTLSSSSESKKFGISTKNINDILGEDGFKSLEKNQLYGSKIKITEVEQQSDGSRTRTITEYELFRFIDATDDNHSGEEIEFEDALSNSTTREKLSELKVGSTSPILEVDSASSFSVEQTGKITFAPTSIGSQTASFKVKDSNGSLAGTISLKGKGTDSQKIWIDENKLEEVLASIADRTAEGLSAIIKDSELQLIDTPEERNIVATEIAEQTYESFEGLGIERGSGTSANTIKIDFLTTARMGLYGTSMKAGGVDNDDAQLELMRRDFFTGTRKIDDYSKVVQNFVLDKAINQNFSGTVEVYPDTAIEFNSISQAQELVNIISKVIAHEAGHTFGLVHTFSSTQNKEVVANGLLGRIDIMAGGVSDINNELEFIMTKEALTMASNLNWSNLGVDNDDGQKALAYYSDFYLKLPLDGGRFDAAEGFEGIDYEQNTFTGPRLAVIDVSTRQPIGDTIDIGTTNVDKTGNSIVTKNIELFNYGNQEVLIKDISLSEPNTVFTINNINSKTNIAPGESTVVELSFNPSSLGKASTNIQIESSDDNLSDRIELTGLGISSNADISVDAPNNNLGGVALDKETSETTDFATIANNGAETLTISDIKLVEGNDTFTLSNIPTDLDTNPINLEFGESFTFGDLTFDPNKEGLDRAVVEVTTNDPENPTVRIDAVGTGLKEIIYPEWGNDYIAIETPNLPNAPVLRTISDDEGNFELFLPPEEDYHMTVFDPDTGLVSHSYGTTAESGQGIDLTASIVFDASTDPDTDSDGLADDIELALGTAASKVDTDNDGIQDLAEIEQGLDPLGGRTLPTGIIGNLSLPGQAKEIAIESSSTGEQLAYVATGSHGLAVVDPSNLTNPIQLGEINLAGDATDVAVDRQLGLAAVATNGGGLQLVDVSDPAMPSLTQTLDLNASQVEIYDGVAYVAVGSSLKAIDLLTGEELGSIASGNAKITGIAKEGTNLYTMNSNKELQVIDIGGNIMTAKDSLTLEKGGGKLFVGNGIAHVISNDFRGGYTTVDVTDADAISLISNPGGDNTNGLPNQAIATNGSGLGLIIGTIVGFNNPDVNNLSIVDTSDPENTFAFLNQVNLPASPQSLAIASGIAYIADGSGGLQVVNYLGFDNQAQAPTVKIGTDADLEPNTDGIQVIEGSSVPIQVDIEEDVQVRNVELLVNGELITNDVSFPFDLNAVALSNEPAGTTVEVQVRATDTGGNSTLSSVLTLNTVPDTFAPEVVGTSPKANTRLKSISGVSLRFDEAIDPELINLEGITLTRVGSEGEEDLTIDLQELQLSGSGRTLYVLPAKKEEFIPGNYQLQLDTSVISDRVGNALEDPLVLNFTKRPPSVPLTLGETVSDTFFAGDESQVFTFDGTAGQTIYFDGISGNTNVDVRLVTPNGINLFNSQDIRNDRAPINLPNTGTYQAIISTNSVNNEDYSFRIHDVVANDLPLDTAIEGSLTDGRGTDLYAFEAQAGDRFYLDGLGTQSQGDFIIYDPRNRNITSTRFNSDREFTVAQDGTYYIAARGNSSSALDYSFNLITSETTTEPLTIGETVTGNIVKAGEQDLYTFEATAGQTLYFDGLTSDSNINVTLTSPTGKSVLSSSSVVSDRNPVTISESGTYQVRVDGYNQTTGDYNFRVRDLESATELALDETVTGSLTDGRGTDLYAFEATAGDRFYLDGLGTQSQGSFIVYDSGNKNITSTRFNSDREFTVPKDGTYYVVARGNNNSAIDYSFNLITSETTTEALTIGETVTGNIVKAGEQDLYTFEATAGQALYFDGLTSDSNINVTLTSPTGKSILSSSSAINDRNPVTVSESGTYQVRVDSTSANTGDYNFRIRDLESATELVLDETVTGSLTDGRGTDLYAFEAEAGDRFYLDGLGTQSQGSFIVYDSGNKSITSTRFNSDREFTVAKDGTYYIAASGYNNEAIDYSFNLITSQTSTEALTIGETVTGNIAKAGEQDLYTFEATAGQTLYFDGLTSDSNINVTLTSPTGKSVLSSNVVSDRNPVTVSESGTYQVRVDSTSANTGDYNFRVRDLESATELVLDETVTGSLTDGRGIDLYAFEATAGDRFYLDGLGTQSQGSFIVYDSGNKNIASTRFNSDREFTVAKDGTYYIAASGFNNEAIDYSFNLITSQTITEPLTIGETVEGNIAKGGEQDLYTFEATAGQTLYFDGLTSDSNINVTLTSPTGKGIISSGGVVNDRNPIAISESGTYQVRVDGTSANTGDYNFRILDFESATTVDLDQIVQGNVAPKMSDVYTFDAVAGQTISLDGIESNNGGIYRIYNPAGVAITSQSFGSDRQFVINNSDTYLVVAQNNSDEAVAHSFQLTQVAFNEPEAVISESLILGETVTSNIGEAGEEDLYTFDATAGQTLYLDGLTGNSSIRATLTSPNGNNLFSTSYVNNDGTPFVISETGTYQLKVKSISSAVTGDYSFRLFDTADATALTLDETVTGTLTDGRATDFYAFEATAGDKFYLDALGTNGNGTFTIYAPGNGQLTAVNFRSDREFTATKDGTYYLAASGYGSTSVDYSFNLVTPQNISQPLVLGETVTSSISEAGEEDLYTFDAVSGQTLYFDGLTSDPNITATLTSPTGKSIFSSNNVVNDGTPVTISESGTYQLKVDGTSANTGDYGFRLQDTADSIALTLDETVTGTLTDGRATDIYAFEATAGDKFYLDALGTNPSGTYRVYAPGNGQLTAINFRSDREFTATKDGTYYLVASGYGSTSVDYSFNLVTPQNISQPLVLGEAVTSSISEVGEEDLYTFDAAAGQTLYFDGLTSDPNITATLTSPTGKSIFSSNNVVNDGTPVTISESGTYQLKVDGTSANTGDYGFRLFDTADATALTLDETVTGTLTDGRATDLYAFEATAGDKFYLDALGTNPSGTYRVYAPGNGQLTAVNFRSDREFTATKDGTYYLVASGYGSTSVDYSFNLVTPQNISQPLVLGEAVTSSISEVGEEDLYTFDAAAGQTLYFDGLTSDPNITATLTSPTGKSIFSSNNAVNDGTPVTISESGTYQLKVDGRSANTGDYGFRIFDTADATALTLDETVTGTLTDGRATDIYAFEATAGDKFYLDSLGTNPSGTYRVYAPSNGQLTAINFRSDVEFTATKDGTHYLVASGYGNEAVDYSFNLVTPQNISQPLVLGEAVTSSISEVGEEDLYTFEASAGQAIYFDGLTSDPNITATLTSPSGKNLFSTNYINGDGSAIAINETGTYQLKVDGRSANTGDYGFRLKDTADAIALTLDETVTGTIADGRSMDLFSFEATAGDRFYLDGLATSGLGSYVVYAPNNQSLGSANFNSDREFIANQDGSYIVAVRGASNEAVDYSFNLVTSPTNTEALVLGETVTGSLGKVGEQDVYTLDINAGQTLFFDSLVDGAGVTTTLISPTGKNVFTSNGDNGDVNPITMTETGNYQLKVDGSGATTGDYSFRLLDTANVTPLTLGQTVTGTLASGRSSELFSFEANTGDKLYLDSLSDSGGYYQIYAPGNQNQGFTYFYSDREFTLTGNGTYLLVARGLGSDQPLDYSFNLNTVDSNS